MQNLLSKDKLPGRILEQRVHHRVQHIHNTSTLITFHFKGKKELERTRLKITK